MFNRRFMDLVRTQLIRVLAEQARAFKATPERPPAEIQELRYGPNDVAAFVDLQNLHYFLKENCRVAATKVHIPNMLNAYAAEHGMALKELQIFTGIHDQQRDPHRHDAMAKRLRWLERCGAKVTALPLSYYTDRITKEVRAQEKGVDVRIASEILRAVNDGLRRAIVVTQDKDIAQSVIVAGEMAAERGRTFHAFTPELADSSWAPNGKCGVHGLHGTVRLPLSVNLVNRYVRAERPRLDSPEGPFANGQEQGI